MLWTWNSGLSTLNPFFPLNGNLTKQEVLSSVEKQVLWLKYLLVTVVLRNCNKMQNYKFEKKTAKISLGYQGSLDNLKALKRQYRMMHGGIKNRKMTFLFVTFLHIRTSPQIKQTLKGVLWLHVKTQRFKTKPEFWFSLKEPTLWKFFVYACCRIWI